MNIHNFFTILIAVSTMAILSACDQQRPFDDLWVTPRPYHAQTPSIRPSANSLQNQNQPDRSDANQNPSGTITLHQAIKLALLQSPKLTAAGWRVSATEADTMQMARPPNPRAGFAIENFSGPSAGGTFERQTLRISQVIELADKRVKRLKLGQATQRLRAWDYEQLRINIASETASRFARAAVEHERVKLAEQQLQLALKGFEIAEERVRNGINPGLEKDKAAARVALSKVQLEQARQNLIAIQSELASSWGADTAAFQLVEADLTTYANLPPLDEIKSRLDQSPTVMRWQDEIFQRRQNYELQQAKAIADPTVGGGIRYFPDIEDTAGLFEISLPLTLLDDNRHGILAARLRVAEAFAQQKDARVQSALSLTQAYTRLQAASFALNTLNDQALPAARSAYQAALDSYQAGLDDYLSVLDAERTLLEIRNQHLNATLQYHLAVIDIEAITAQPITTAEE